MEHHGLIALLPTLVVLIIALKTKKTFDALLGGSLVGFLLLYQASFFTGFTETFLKVMQDPTIAWVILVCGLFGSLIQLLVVTGGASAFANRLLRFVKSRNSALLMTWLMGLFIFIDDYLNALTVGNSMKKVTDKFKVPREMLAYVVDATAAPICVLVPLSTWAIYIASLLETTQVTEQGMGLTGYLMAIPFITYGWVAALMVPLVVLRVIPPLGAMKAAEARVSSGGPLAPPNSSNIAMKMEQKENTQPIVADFVAPILVLIAATLYFGIDALKGILIALAFVLVYQPFFRKQINFGQAMDEIFKGFKTMIYALSIIIMSFVLKEVNDGLGLTNFVIENVAPIMNKVWLPAIAFLTLSMVTFATGSFWGVYAITLPIIIPLANSMEVHLWLAIGSVISAGAFGSHACFYGDTTILSSSATGCNNISHVLSQLPYTLLAGLVTFLVYVVLGFTM